MSSASLLSELEHVMTRPAIINISFSQEPCSMGTDNFFINLTSLNKTEFHCASPNINCTGLSFHLQHIAKYILTKLKTKCIRIYYNFRNLTKANEFLISGYSCSERTRIYLAILRYMKRS